MQIGQLNTWGMALAATLLGSGVGSLVLTNATPLSWAVASLSVWSVFVLGGAKDSLRQSAAHIVWAYASTAAFVCYLATDPGFQSWSDVYYFCSDPRFCTCDFRWTWLGYMKFAVLWNFILSAALGVQKLVVDFLLDGLLPGEELVTKESFVSICWRLIPYWLNNWEQEWGAECSSALFELPHFALELLVVLPTVQIICSRLRILALPQLRVVVPAEMGEQMDEIPREDLAPNVMRGHWQLDPEQRSLAARLSANKRVMLVLVGVALLAAANATLVPVSMEAAVQAHPRSQLLAAMPLGAGPLPLPLQGMQDAFHGRGCPSVGPISRVMRKHARELARMADPEHVRLVPRIEAALAVMRLACEKFFVLASVFAAFLLWREPPMGVRHVIALNANLSDAFQKVVLYTFPAICWVWGAGILFSAFVSLVFWSGPVLRLVEVLRLRAATVQPAVLTPATPAEVERMDGRCAVCWADMGPGGRAAAAEAQPPQPSSRPAASGASSLALSQQTGGGGGGGGGGPPGVTLACGHSFHEDCIVRWLHQCHGQGRSASCPMCAASVELRIQWRMPFFQRTRQPAPGADDGEDEAEGGGPAGGWRNPRRAGLPWFPEIQAMIQDMDDFRGPHPGGPPAMGPGDRHVPLGPLPAATHPRPPPPPPPAAPASSVAATASWHSGPSAEAAAAEAAASEQNTASSVPQPPAPPQRLQPWQRQLEQGVSFGGGMRTRSRSRASLSAGEAQLHQPSAHLPFSGRAYRLGTRSSSGAIAMDPHDAEVADTAAFHPGTHRQRQ